MSKVIITSGGTSEPIDSVRKITNSSSGRLGAMIAEEIKVLNPDIEIHYVAPKKAIKPNIDIVYHEVSDTISVQHTLQEIVDQDVISIVHSMAISDYIVKSVLDKTGKELDRTKKISSDNDSLTVNLIKAPKIINELKKLNPNSKLIGFKLLNKASETELISAAIKQIQTANSDYVLCNDLSEINATQHKAIVVDKTGKKIAFLTTKKEIAAYIAHLAV